MEEVQSEVVAEEVVSTGNDQIEETTVEDTMVDEEGEAAAVVDEEGNAQVFEGGLASDHPNLDLPLGSRTFNKDFIVPKKAFSDFCTGIDFLSEEEKAKRAARAAKWGVAVVDAEAQPLPADEIEKIQARQEKWGCVVPDSGISATGFVDLEKAHADPVDLTPERREAAVHVCGTWINKGPKSTQDVLRVFSGYGASHVEWIDGFSCNVVFLDQASAHRALAMLSYQPQLQRYLTDQQWDDIANRNLTEETINLWCWRLAKVSTPDQICLFRTAHVGDVKVHPAERKGWKEYFRLKTGRSARGRGDAPSRPAREELNFTTSRKKRAQEEEGGEGGGGGEGEGSADKEAKTESGEAAEESRSKAEQEGFVFPEITDEDRAEQAARAAEAARKRALEEEKLKNETVDRAGRKIRGRGWKQFNSEKAKTLEVVSKTQRKKKVVTLNPTRGSAAAAAAAAGKDKLKITLSHKRGLDEDEDVSEGYDETDFPSSSSSRQRRGHGSDGYSRYRSKGLHSSQSSKRSKRGDGDDVSRHMWSDEDASEEQGSRANLKVRVKRGRGHQ